jgi:hypothetical protein
MIRNTSILAILLGLACLTLSGCSKGPTAKVITGDIACGSEKVPLGEVSFVPIEGNTARICGARIIEGQYRIDTQGGVPLGKYRVQVDARKRTGRKVEGFLGIEKAMIDEEVRLGPERYANQNSPLVVDIRTDSDGRFHIAIPPK